jgi:hypothetical protein
MKRCFHFCDKLLQESIRIFANQVIVTLRPSFLVIFFSKHKNKKASRLHRRLFGVSQAQL